MPQLFQFSSIRVVAVSLFDPLYEVTPTPEAAGEKERLRQTLEASIRMDYCLRRIEQLSKTQHAYSQVETLQLCRQGLSGRRWQ